MVCTNFRRISACPSCFLHSLTAVDQRICVVACARNLHAEDGFARNAANESHAPAVFDSNALGQGQTQSRALLFTLANKRLKERATYRGRHSIAVVGHRDL